MSFPAQYVLYSFLASIASKPPSSAQAVPSPDPAAPLATNDHDVAEAGPSAVADGMVELDVHDVLYRDDILKWLESHVQSVLTELGVTPPGDPKSPWAIRIEVTGSTHDYRASVSATRGSSRVGATDLAPCRCDSKGLMAFVQEQLREVIRELQALPPSDPLHPPQPQVPTNSHPTPTPLISSSSPSTPDVTPTDARRKIGGLGVTGLVLLGAGTIPLGIGIDRLVREPEPDVIEEGRMTYRYGVPGSATATGIGAAAMLTGTVFILVDQFVCKQRERGCRRDRPYSRAHRRAVARHE